MHDLNFIHEKSNVEKVRALIGLVGFIAIFVIIGALFATTWYGLRENIPVVRDIFNVISGDIESASPWVLLYVEFFASLFFIPSPDELIYFYILSKQESILLCFIAVNIGYMLAQAVNYFLGLKLSKPLVNLMSKRKLYAARRWSNKHGSLGIFLANIVPFLPSPLMTFGLGLTKYNFYRLMWWALVGRVLKYGVVTMVFIWTT